MFNIFNCHKNYLIIMMVIDFMIIKNLSEADPETHFLGGGGDDTG